MITKRLLILLCLLTSAGLTAGAQPRWEDGERGPGRGVRGGDGLRDELNLTEKQEEEIGRLRLDLRKKMDAQRARIREARFELRKILRAETVDRAAAERQIAQMSDAEQRMETARLDHWISVRSILSPEQVKIWADRPMEGRGGPGGFRGRGMHRNGPRGPGGPRCCW